MTDNGEGEPAPIAGPSKSRPSSFPLSGRISLTSPPQGRLTSLRSRDLTLGGFKKKTFVPNVHSVRKSKEELREDTHTAPKKERREDRQREARRKRERPQVIQSHSIFEQGPADTIRKIGSWGTSDLPDCGPAVVPKYVKKEKVSKEEENEILQKLQRDDFIDDPGLVNDIRQRPIQLPLRESSSFLSEPALPGKEESSAETKSPVGLAGLGVQHPTVGDLFQRLSLLDREELLFVQLPDAIPGQPASKGTEAPPKKDGKADDKLASRAKAELSSMMVKSSCLSTKVETPSILANLAAKPALSLCTHEPVESNETAPVLANFSEGLIGKLQIRKSGRVQLVLGDIKLDVSEGAAFSFLQQLVSVRLSDGLGGDLSVLGNVQHKLVCSPDFQTLLQGVKRPSNNSTGKS